jgi:hypothetical protein
MSEIRPEVLELDLADTGLDVRIVNAMERGGIFTVRQLLLLSPNEFCGYAGCGKNVLAHTINHLRDYRPHAWEPDCLADWMLGCGIDPLVITTLLGCRFSDVVDRRKAIDEIKAAQHVHQLSIYADVPLPGKMPELQEEAKEWQEKIREEEKIKRRKGKPAVAKTVGNGTKRFREKEPVRLCLPGYELDAIAIENG